MNDEELIEAYTHGDDFSFQELIRRTLKPVFNFVYLYVQNTDETEDIVQDTFFKAWKYMSRFKKGHAWKPWVFTIARNTTLDHIKKKKALPFSTLDVDEDADPFSDTVPDLGPLADELFERAHDAEELSDALSKLRPEYHSVVMLHYHQGLTFEEIAIVISAPMNTVKSWHRRALDQIKEEVGNARAPK